MYGASGSVVTAEQLLCFHEWQAGSMVVIGLNASFQVAVRDTLSDLYCKNAGKNWHRLWDADGGWKTRYVIVAPDNFAM